MASKVDMSLDDIVKSKKGAARKKPGVGAGGAAQKFKPSIQNGGTGSAKSVSDLRSVLAKKQLASISDLRAKLKPKALYTKKLTSRVQQQQKQATKGNQKQKRLSLTPNFKNSISSAVGSNPGGMNESFKKPSRGSRSRRSDPGPGPGPISHRTKSSSSKLPSYEEAKKISVTVPGLSRPVSEYSSLRREERLAAQIAWSREMRQDSYSRGREEFLASTISSAVGSGGLSSGSGGTHGGGGGSDRDRSMGMFSRLPRSYPSRSPSPPVPDYGSSSFDHLYSTPPLHAKAPPLHLSSYSSGSSSKRGITTATSMFISNLSDTVSKNDVAELCSVVGSLDGVYMHAPGIAEVVFKYKDDALEAFKKYNMRNLDGQPMHCKLQPASRSRLTGSGSGYGHSYADDLYSHTSSGFY